VQQFGEFIRHEVARVVPHRQIVLTLPKRLRRAFQFDRGLLDSLCLDAWLSIRDCMRLRLGCPGGQPGVVIAIHTFGDYLNFHPHLHILVTDGLFTGRQTFCICPRNGWDRVEELFRNRVLHTLVGKGRLTAGQAAQMLAWHHSGFSAHAGYRIQTGDHDALERLAQYILRNPFSLDKMTYLPDSGEVIYRSKRNHATGRNWERYDAPAFIAAITQHIPQPRQHLVRYYGAYSNRARGELRKSMDRKYGQTKRGAAASATSKADPTAPPTCLSLADFVHKQESAADLARALAHASGTPLSPHDDEWAQQPCNPAGPESGAQHDSDKTVVNTPCETIEIIELPREQLPLLPRKKWRELIIKVWETDPLRCPRCAHLMRVDALVEDPVLACAILASRGWLAHATSAAAPRAPPAPDADDPAPELPFTSDADGITYELEPWELARRERLAAWKRERAHLAGIIEYDGEWQNYPHTQAQQTRGATVLSTQVATYQGYAEEWDQRPRPEWEAADWDQSSRKQGLERQFSQRSPTSARPGCNPVNPQRELWEGIDPIPSDDLPTWTYD
jgi:hypothetical protein